jgi:hypothetical protein
MALPRVKIIIGNGALGAVSASPDGLLGIISSASAVADKFDLNKPFLVGSYDDLNTLGITAENNPALEKIVREFYDEAGAGTRVYIMGVVNTVSMTDMLDVNNSNNARKLIEVSQGAVRGIVVSHTPPAGYVPVITDGINEDVYTAIAKGQQLGEWAAEQKFAPLFVIVEGRNFTGDGTPLADLTQRTDNRVGVLIGDTASGTNGAAVGLIAGRIAKSPVQRNVGRVKDGAVKAQAIYIANDTADVFDVATLNEKGFISFRTWTGRAGYFFTDDNLATLAKDDYKHLTYRRTIDKAYRIAYDALVDEMLDEIPLAADGTMQPAYASSMGGIVERAISTQMTQAGELSADPSDPNDIGVTCFVDPAQNVVATGIVQVKLGVRPYGYSRYVNVDLGFKVSA